MAVFFHVINCYINSKKIITNIRQTLHKSWYNKCVIRQKFCKSNKRGTYSMKNIYFIRHCSAKGQYKDSPLTNKGVRQSYALANFFHEQRIPIDRMISSPYLRAVDSIRPFAQTKKINIDLDERLQERVLSSEPLDDWYEILEHTFHDMDYKLPGGESSHEATNRALVVMKEIIADEDHSHILIATHGNLLTLILRHYDEKFGFDDWRRMQNPDIFLMHYEPGHLAITQQEWNI